VLFASSSPLHLGRCIRQVSEKHGYQTARCYSPEGITLHSHFFENPKSDIKLVSCLGFMSFKLTESHIGGYADGKGNVIVLGL
jgi:hypothetical protein